MKLDIDDSLQGLFGVTHDTEQYMELKVSKRDIAKASDFCADDFSEESL